MAEVTISLTTSQYKLFLEWVNYYQVKRNDWPFKEVRRRALDQTFNGHPVPDLHIVGIDGLCSCQRRK